MQPVRIQVWSDIVCPWCYIGKRRLEAALAQYGQPVEVVWRAFELDPSAPTVAAEVKPIVERLASKYRRSLAEAQKMLDQVTDTARAEGLDFHFEHARPANTFDAHRVLHLAHLRGVQAAVKERLMRAYFTEGALVSDHDTLAKLAAEAGLDSDEVRRVLAADTYGKEVRADQAQARTHGISGVPFFVINERVGVSGAQSPEALVAALRQAAQAA